jgi:hypothetical protein
MHRGILISSRIRDLLFLPNQGTEDAIDKSRPSLSPKGFCYFHGLIDCCGSWGASEKKELIDSKTEEIDNLGLGLLERDLRQMANHPIEPFSPSQGTVG